MDNETIMKFLPNYIAPGMGEDMLIDKIAPFIDTAENWVNSYIVAQRFTDGNTELQELRNNIIAVRALYLAAPALDVTMHPNGLAVVNTDSLAPASAERSKEFRKTLDKQTLEHIDRFLEHVYNEGQSVKFLSTAPGSSMWGATIFKTCADLISYTDTEPTWDHLINSLHHASALENRIAEKFISYRLLHRFRLWKDNLPQPSDFLSVISDLKSVIGKSIAANVFPDFNDMRPIVERIRKRPDIFPEWHESSTANLFDPPVFKNQKKSGGYFF